jgi:signal transduction histidine kinase
MQELSAYDPPAPLAAVLITDELARRPARLPDHRAENAALHDLARRMAAGPRGLLDALAAAAVALCRAGTGGVSVPEEPPGGPAVFRWVALAGALAAHAGGGTPRDFSPCAVTLARGAPQLFDRPARHFAYFAAVAPPILEGLVVPLDPADPALGTIWVVAHDGERQFDAEDARIMASLGAFAAAALRQAAVAAANARLYREGQATLRLHDELLDTIAHDLRQPLTGVKAHAQLLRRRLGQGAAPEALAEGLGRIERAAGQLDAQIAELVEVGRVRAGQPLELHRAPTDLVALAREVAAGHAARGHDVAVAAAVPALVGEWDSVRLIRVLENLLGNAAKYSPAGSPIAVALAREGDRAVLRVRDAGIGIPAADLPHLFERFYRARNAIGRASGTGLGLAGVRRIVEEHGGTIGIASAEGAGTTVTVHLPLATSVCPPPQG